MTPAVLVGLLLCVALPADQEGERERVFGEVRARDGRVWAAARVTLWSRACPRLDDAGSADVIEVRCDEHGRFRARVLPWRTYSVWARGPVTEDGLVRVTDVAESVVPNTPVVLRELARPRRSGAVQWEGLEAWQHRAPFRCRIAVDVEHVPEVVVAVDRDGRLTVPPLPGERARVELFGRQDHPIHWLDVEPGSLPVSLELPPPQAIELRPTTLGGRKFAGGRLVAAWRGRAWHVADVAAEGRTVELPRGARPWSYRLLAPGLAPGILGPREGDERVWAGRLVLGASVRGRLSIRRGVPAARWTLAVRHGSYTHQPDSHWVGSFDEVVTTDDRGRFALPCTFRPAVRVVLDADRDRWPVSWRSGVLDVAWLGDDPTEVGEVDVGEIVLEERWWVAHVRLVDPDGAPAIGGHLTFAPGGESGDGTVVSTDRSGRARLLLPRGDLAVVGRRGDAWRVLRIHLVGAALTPIPWSVRLDPPVRVTGRVVDAGGVPLSERRINIWPMHDAPAAVLGAPSEPVAGAGYTLEASLGFADNRLQSLLIGELNRRPTVTDAAGRFTLSLPRVTCTLQAHGHPDARHLVGDPFAFDGATIDGLELRVRR